MALSLNTKVSPCPPLPPSLLVSLSLFPFLSIYLSVTLCVSHFPSFSLPFPLPVSLFIPPSYLTFQVCLPCAPADGPSQCPVQFVSASSRLVFWPQLSTLHPSVSLSPNSCTETSPTKVFLPKPKPRRLLRLQRTHPLRPKPALGAPLQARLHTPHYRALTLLSAHNSQGPMKLFP